MLSRSIHVTGLCGIVLGTAACGSSADPGSADVPRVDSTTTDTRAYDAQMGDVSGIDVEGPDVRGRDAQAVDVVDGALDGAGTDGTSTDDASATDGASGGDDATDAAHGDAGTTACPTPRRALATSDMYLGTLSDTGVIPSASCQGDTSGGEDVFTLHVAATTGLQLTTDSTMTTVDTVVSIRTVCGDLGSEVACDDDDAVGSSSTVRTVLAPGDYTVIVDGAGGDSGPYLLTVSTYTPATNATCAMAATLTAGTPITGQDSANGGAASYACDPANPGAQLFYALTIPAGQAATITATPAGATQVEVRALDDCGATTCLAADIEASLPSVIGVNNPGATPRRVIVTAAGTSSTRSAQFTLSAAFEPSPYVETTIATACDDLTTGAAVLAGPTTDDATSSIAALPFALQFFGTAVADYSVASNGFAQLWPSATGTPADAFFNAAIPNTADPNGIVAPFWDDLYPGPVGAVRVATFGAAPYRRFTIEWNGWTFYEDTTAALRFQAKLFETTNVIEFHYCTLVDGTAVGRATGASATVGLENLGGTDGVAHSDNTAGAVGTTTALRYTPAS